MKFACFIKKKKLHYVILLTFLKNYQKANYLNYVSVHPVYGHLSLQLQFHTQVFLLSISEKSYKFAFYLHTCVWFSLTVRMQP